MKSKVDFECLAAALRRKRALDKSSLSEVTAVTGISPSTLSRIENHEIDNVTADMLLTLCDWLERPVSDFVKSDKPFAAKVSFPDGWMVEFSPREMQEIKFARFYAADFAHGTDGHNAKIIIAKLADLLDRLESQLDITRTKNDT